MQNINQIQYNKTYQVFGRKKVSQKEFSNSKQKSSIIEDKKNKITFYKASKLVIQGFLSQIKDVFSSVIHHPVKTAFSICATTGALMLLPIVGIPTSLGATVLTVAFGISGAVNIFKNTKKAISQNKNGEIEKAGESFKRIGSSGLDLALAVPFLPKSLKTSFEFSKYGKLSINRPFLNDLKNSKISNLFEKSKDANTEILRNYDYQAAVDKQLSKINAPADELKTIKRELLDFNVPRGNIAKVALEKLKKRYGYDFDIPFEKMQLSESSMGYFDPIKGKIVIKNLTEPSLSEPSTPKLSICKVENADFNNYICTIVESKTGKKSFEMISKKIFNKYKTLAREEAALSQQGREILALVHEFEHMNQFSKMAQLYGNLSNSTFSAKALNKNIANANGSLKTPEIKQITRYKTDYMNYTSENPVKYLKNELEVGARNKEYEALKSKDFQNLENVFKHLKTPFFHTGQTLTPIIIQTVREKFVIRNEVT